MLPVIHRRVFPAGTTLVIPCLIAATVSMIAVDAAWTGASTFRHPPSRDAPFLGSRPPTPHSTASSFVLQMTADEPNESSRGKKRSESRTEPLQHHNVTATVEKKIRVAKAQAEIDRILKGPDAPFDLETELKNVVSIAPADQEEEEETAVDAEISQLEQDLYAAVKQQDYSTAATKKQEISQRHMDDCGAVLQVNSAFYRAFSEKDYKSMESLWLHDATATCIHPSSKSLIGSKAVLHSWKRMFAAGDGSFQRNWMEPADIRLSIKGASMAILSCDEHVYARRFVRGQKRQTELINKLTATNIFRKVAGKWWLCHHHASWHADSQAAQQALRGAADHKPLFPQPPSLSSGSDADAPQQQHGASPMDGILGTTDFGPLLGDDDKQGKKPIKRIVVGNLNDILSGNLGDLLSNNQDDDAQNEEVIHLSSADAELEEVVVEDVEENDGMDGNDDDGNPTETLTIKEWATTASSSDSEEEPSGATVGSDSEPKDALRQDCISALRRLASQGSISPKQKRLLLTDIITCSAKGEFSMVEVAYELLCGEGDDKEAAEEEFADQCRVFAHSLPTETPPSSP